jgi:hypothetical protein
MSAKVYILIDLVDADSAQVAQILRRKPGVAEIDILEGAPSIMMVIEAPERLKAGEYLVNILDSVEGVTDNLRVLPVDKSITESAVKIRRAESRSEREMVREEHRSCLSVL